MSISKISPFHTIYVVKHLDLVCICENDNDDKADMKIMMMLMVMMMVMVMVMKVGCLRRICGIS